MLSVGSCTLSKLTASVIVVLLSYLIVLYVKDVLTVAVVDDEAKAPLIEAAVTLLVSVKSPVPSYAAKFVMSRLASVTTPVVWLVSVPVPPLASSTLLPSACTKYASVTEPVNKSISKP